MGNTIKFGQLTAAKKEDIKAIVQDAQDNPDKVLIQVT